MCDKIRVVTNCVFYVNNTLEKGIKNCLNGIRGVKIARRMECIRIDDDMTVLNESEPKMTYLYQNKVYDNRQ